MDEAHGALEVSMGQLGVSLGEEFPEAMDRLPDRVYGVVSRIFSCFSYILVFFSLYVLNNTLLDSPSMFLLGMPGSINYLHNSPMVKPPWLPY